MSQEEIEYNLSTIKNTYFIKIFIGIIIVIVLSFLLMTRIFNNNNYLTINDAKLVGSKVEVKSKVSGLLGNVTVAEGTNVKAGDIIAKIDVTDIVKKRNELELKLKEAKLNYAKLKATNTAPPQINTYSANVTVNSNSAEIELAKANKEKMEKLFSLGAISKNQYNQAVEDYNKALAIPSSEHIVVNNTNVAVKDTLLETATIQIRQLESAMEGLNFTNNFSEIIAPVAGKVKLMDIEPQHNIKAGDTVMEIIADENIFIEASVVQNEKIKIGQYVECYFNGSSFIEGTIADITTVTDDKDRNVMLIKIILPKDKLRDYEVGQMAKVIVHL